MTNPVFDLSAGVTILPVVHGSAFFAREARLRLRHEAGRGWDCLAVALPPSFAAAVEEGVERLPRVSVAIQEEGDPFAADARQCSYVPIDPCQPLIEAV